MTRRENGRQALMAEEKERQRDRETERRRRCERERESLCLSSQVWQSSDSMQRDGNPTFLHHLRVQDLFPSTLTTSDNNNNRLPSLGLSILSTSASDLTPQGLTPGNASNVGFTQCHKPIIRDGFHHTLPYWGGHLDTMTDGSTNTITAEI